MSSFVSEPFHFQTQLSDGSIVVELYYPGQTTKGFGTYFKFPSQAPEGQRAMGPANMKHPANAVGHGGFPWGRNLASRFQALPGDRWELALKRPIRELPRGTLTVSIKDRQGNVTELRRTFSVADPERVAQGK